VNDSDEVNARCKIYIRLEHERGMVVRNSGTVVSVVISLLLFLPAISSADFITLSVTGQRQGIIKGGNTAKGLENTIAVQSFSLDMKSPHEAASGLPTGVFKPSPVGIVKEFDRATPFLLQAFVMNETLTSVVIRYYGTTTTGKPENAFTIVLTNASLGTFNAGISAQGTGATSENLELFWQKLELRDERLQTSTVVDWVSPYN
jgi:type VI secretion system secreted protein Hcp